MTAWPVEILVAAGAGLLGLVLAGPAVLRRRSAGARRATETRETPRVRDDLTRPLDAPLSALETACAALNEDGAYRGLAARIGFPDALESLRSARRDPERLAGEGAGWLLRGGRLLPVMRLALWLEIAGFGTGPHWEALRRETRRLADAMRDALATHAGVRLHDLTLLQSADTLPQPFETEMTDRLRWADMSAALGAVQRHAVSVPTGFVVDVLQWGYASAEGEAVPSVVVLYAPVEW